ncbi:MAG: hypothetical protein KF850_04580 [Labilithrix sp.]|nr:hypothetical protein [Labilithrix sp.]MBX3211287.1 hypothetical protein [Labilithrix sp.]MBX3264071.1 hypothetical protein [Labilithrix sp.]MCW5834202.1 hypothetical protein [Labilithrix sp.]
MHSDPKRDAQKTEEAGLNAEPLAAPPSVAKPDAPGEEGIETAREQAPPTKKDAPRPRQDSLDRERAAGEGMPAPSSDR